jgi:potassium efflux system protein
VNLAGWGGIALMSIAIVSNVAGNVSLAETLTDGVIDSSYMALMLYAGVHVCAELLGWLFGERPGMPRRAASLVRLSIRVLAWAAFAGWLVFTLERFRVYRPIYALLSALLTAHLEVGEISISLGNVLVFVIAVLISFWAARGVRTLVHDEVLGRLRLARGVGNTVASLIYYAILLLGLLMALSAAGFKMSQLTLVFGALGVGIGFGLQNVVNNYVSGLVLMFERPIQPGDVIDVGTTSGTVGEIGLRATTIRTFDGADVVVPNGALLAGNLTNWTLRDRSRRMELTVGVAYGSVPADVIALLQATALQTPGIVTRPEPAALFMAFAPGSLEFSVRAWTYDFDNWLSIRSDLASRVHRAFADAGIEIPFPQRDLHLRSVAQDALDALDKKRE